MKTSINAKLRKQAEEIANATTAPSPITSEDSSPENIHRLFHELQIHKIELEMLNEQLQQAHMEMEQRIIERTADLMESEKRYRELFEAESDAIVLVDTMANRLLDVNRAVLSLYGYSRDELLTKKQSDISVEPDDIQHYIEAAASAPEQILHIPFRLHRKKDGTVFPVEINARYSTLGGRPVFIVSIRDITERKRKDDVLQARLRLSEFSITHSLDELLQRTLDEAELLTGSSIGFFHFVDKDQNALKLQACSTNTLNTMCSAVGKGQHYDVMLAGIWTDCLLQRKPVIHNDYISVPNRKGLPPGHAAVVRELTIPIIRGDQVVAILGVGNKAQDYIEQDIETLETLASLVWEMVERKQVEEALHENEKLFNQFVRRSPIYCYIKDVDPAYSRVLQASDNFQQMIGITASEMIGKTMQELYSPEFAAKITADDWAVVSEGKTIQVAEELNGRIYTTIKYPIVLGDRTLLAGYTIDITENKQAEEALAGIARRDSHIAEVFQRTVMPVHMPTFPAGYQIATKYQPASNEADVCGDFCDIFDLGEGNIGISFGDIVGKGLLAAVRVTAAKNMIRSYAFLFDRPSKVMSLVNDALCRDIAMENDMLTAFFAILDTRSHTLVYSNAGHEPPLVRHSDGKIEYLKREGSMFCGFGKQVYLEGCLNIQSGDVFVAVTDGITEASIDKRSEQFGAEGIINSVNANPNATAQQISIAILEGAIDFANGTLQDDSSILVIKKVDS